MGGEARSQTEETSIWRHMIEMGQRHLRVALHERFVNLGHYLSLLRQTPLDVTANQTDLRMRNQRMEIP